MREIADKLANKGVPALIIGEKGLLTSIAKTGIPVILGHELKSSPVLWSKYARFKVPFSSYDSKQFINEMCTLGKMIGRRMVILSDDDRALLNISKNRERLRKYYLFNFPDNSIVEKLLDKQSFSEFAEEHNLPVPKTYKVKSVSTLKKVALRITYPCIIKPVQRHHWWGNTFVETLGFYKKAVRCDNIGELKKNYNLISKINPSIVLQEYIHGEDDQHFSVNLFADKTGKILGHYTAQKIRVYPVTAGTGTFIKTIRSAEIEQLCFEIVAKLNLKGLINIQFKQDSKTEKYMLMEIHIRNSLWSLLGSKAGANLGEQYYQSLTSDIRSKNMVIARPNVKYINLSHDILAALHYYREDKLTVYQWLNSLRGERVFALSSFSDPMPALYKIHSTVKNRFNLVGRNYYKAPKKLTNSNQSQNDTLKKKVNGIEKLTTHSEEELTKN